MSCLTLRLPDPNTLTSPPSCLYLHTDAPRFPPHPDYTLTPSTRLERILSSSFHVHLLPTTSPLPLTVFSPAQEETASTLPFLLTLLIQFRLLSSFNNHPCLLFSVPLVSLHNTICTTHPIEHKPKILYLSFACISSARVVKKKKRRKNVIMIFWR